MAIGLHPSRIALGGVLALLAFFAAFWSWSDAHFAYLRGSHSELAHAARPDDALSLGKTIDRRLQTGAGSPVSQTDIRLARTSLIEAPLSRSILRIIGIEAELTENMARADAAMRLSDAISRRDAMAQLWLIERSVRKEDMNGAVRHYHAAMSTHPELKPALLPILSKAISFPEVRSALTPYFFRQAPWTPDLMKMAMTQGDPADLARLIIPVGEVVRSERYEGLSAALITRLAESGDFAMAVKLAEAVIPDVNPRTLTSLSVNEVTTDKRLGGLAWKFAEDGRVLTSSNGLGGFDIDVEPLASGPAAVRIVPVVGGRSYLFSQTRRGSGDGSSTAMVLSWRAYCLPVSSKSRAPIWQQVLPEARQTRQYEFEIAVPLGCKGLQLALVARGPEGQIAGHAVLEALNFRPRSN